MIIWADEQEDAGGNAAAGLSARISEIGAGHRSGRNSTGEGDGGADGMETISASDIWDD